MAGVVVRSSRPSLVRASSGLAPCRGRAVVVWVLDYASVWINSVFPVFNYQMILNQFREIPLFPCFFEEAV